MSKIYNSLWYIFVCTTVLSFIIDAKKIPVITNPVRKDGFGAQFQTIIASAICAELTGQQYVYSPFKNMEHNYDSDAHFIKKKENLINFIDNFNLYDSTKHTIIKTYKSPRCFIEFFESHIEECAHSNTLQKIKLIFRAHKNKTDYFDTQRFNIAIHIRRHNQDDNRIKGTDTPDELFLHIIEQLRIVYAHHNPVFHIYSQGHTEHFTLFYAPDIELHLNESVEKTFASFVFADVLVTSPSSLSYTA